MTVSALCFDAFLQVMHDCAVALCLISQHPNTPAAS